MTSQEFTLEGVLVGQQVSKLGNLPIGDYQPAVHFYLKNNTTSIIELEVRGVSNAEGEFVTTSIFPGWNPEILIEVRGNTSDKLQWGR